MIFRGPTAANAQSEPKFHVSLQGSCADIPPITLAFPTVRHNAALTTHNPEFSPTQQLLAATFTAYSEQPSSLSNRPLPDGQSSTARKSHVRSSLYFPATTAAHLAAPTALLFPCAPFLFVMFIVTRLAELSGLEVQG